MSHDDDPTRLNVLELELHKTQEKLMFAEHTVAELVDALGKKELALHALERRVDVLEAAVRTLAQRTAAPKADDIKNAQEDPVPSSG